MPWCCAVGRLPHQLVFLQSQLFFQSSEESDVSGLGWLEGKSIKFQIENSKYKVPHIGWNNLDIISDDSLLKGINTVAKKLGISVDTGKGYRALANISEDGGQEVAHLHFHLFGGEKIGKMVS